MATTTNYGWDTPDDTDLVKDGASAIRTLGSSIDTTTKNLNPETTTGDIAYRSATSNVNTRLAIGSAGQVLTVAAGVPSWATPTDQTPLTTKGDVFTFSTVDARLGVGANGTVLTADSSETTGLKWSAPAASGGMTLVETLTLSGSSTTSSSIANTYKHLYVVCKNLTASGNTDCFIRFNSDTGSNYFRNIVSSEAPSTVAGGGASSQTKIILLSLSTSTGAGQRGRVNFWVPRYTDTDETYITSNSFGYEGAQKQKLVDAVYDNSAAISTITFGLDSGTFSNGTVYIYGVS